MIIEYPKNLEIYQKAFNDGVNAVIKLIIDNTWYDRDLEINIIDSEKILLLRNHKDLNPVSETTNPIP